MSELAFEPVDQCMLCGAREQHDARGVSWNGVAFSYCYCGGCGLKYMRPRPTEASYLEFYRSGFWPQKMAATGFATADSFDDTSIDQLALRMPKYEAGYRRVVSALEPLGLRRRGVRILEVGCAWGFSLEWLRDRDGLEVAGIEPSDEARKRCESAGIRLVGRTAEDMTDDGRITERFDLVMFRHSLENVVHPIPVLEGARRLLTDEGRLLVFTPNLPFFDSMNPYHPYIYAEDTLAALLRSAGLDPCWTRATPVPTTRAEALATLYPDAELAMAARRGRVVRAVPQPALDVLELARQHANGLRAVAWAELGAEDLVARAARLTGARARNGARKVARALGRRGS